MTNMNRQEWLENRKKYITGSDASSIIGCNPYCNNQELFDLKMGRKQREDISEKPYVKYGLDAEKPLIELFMLDYPQYEVTTKEFDFRVHKDYEFLAGTLDGELRDKDTGELGILEIKTTNILQSMQMEKWSDRIPNNYFTQVLHYLLVTGYSFAILKAQLKTNWKGEIRTTARHYMIKADEHKGDIDFLLEKELAFYECIKKDERPGLVLPAI